jgi:hypothetical protein
MHSARVLCMCGLYESQNSDSIPVQLYLTRLYNRESVYCAVRSRPLNGGESGTGAGSSSTEVFACQYQSINALCSTYIVLLQEGQSWEALEPSRNQ